jgi:hypothetical protein
MSIFMAVVFPFICPKKPKNFSFIDPKMLQRKAAKFLLRFRTSMILLASPFPERKGVFRYYLVFLIVHVVYNPAVLETLQENYKSIKRLR